MPFPQKFEELKPAGYRFDNHGLCRGCNAEIEWWVTPSGKKIPFNLMVKDLSPVVAHFVTCPDREQFRRG